MAKANRRDFFRAAGTTSAAIFLTGSSTFFAGNPGKDDEGFDIEDQIDPWIELDLDNLASNVSEVRKKIGTRPIMAVVKCNAYGHGAVEIATAMQNKSKVNHFAVVKVREGLILRQNNIKGMILNMGVFNRPETKGRYELSPILILYSLK